MGNSDNICSVDDCGRTAFNDRGWCQAHYKRWQKYGDIDADRPVRFQKRGDTEACFWAKVQKTESCWNWTGSTSTVGYGQLRVAGRILWAHRMSYERVNGPIPAGMQIDHICHNRLCVNPDHLRVATKKQNMENPAGLRSHNKSGVRGVSWMPRLNKWRATVVHNRRQTHVGVFVQLADAEAAVVAKRNELFTHNDKDRQR